jgi:hypothetical protein
VTEPRPIARSPSQARLLAVTALAIGLAGCGSSSTHSTSSAVTVVSANAGAPAGRAHAGTRKDPVHADTSPEVAHNSNIFEPNAPIHQLNPCTLVSAAKASAVTGYPIARTIEAPLGPTCIYVPRGAGRELTLSITPAAQSLRPRLQSVSTVRIAGHVATCGSLGGQIMLVPLSGHLLLTIDAPCAAAASIAKQTLARLDA